MTSQKTFREELLERSRQVQEILYRYLPREEGYQSALAEAMNYSMTAGGKRLRPLLMLETYRLFGGKGRAVEPFMAAMEMIHTHSLIHDDLPALDNDEYRRGRKTTHVVYGEAMAILAGDALLNYAYETACRAFACGEDAANIGKALGILAEKTGIRGMLGGQAVDVQSAGSALSEDKLDFIYRLKTGALIEASMMIGAVLAGASAEETAVVEKVAGLTGLAFQIQDDILDLTGTQQEIGKPTGSDERNHKTTYVTLRGLEAAKKDVEELSARAAELLGSLPGENRFLEELIRELAFRRN